MMASRVLLLASVVLAASGGVAGGATDAVLARYRFAAAPANRWELPQSLSETSGLAIDAAGHIFAHDDERAIVFQLDPASHRVVRRFALGQPAVRGDFEAIALVDDRVVLATSDGVLYTGPQGRDGEAVPFVMYPTGVGRLCEVEGLSYEARDRSLLLACKVPRVKSLRGSLTVFRWSLDRRELVSTPRLLVPLRRIAPLLGRSTFHPSELARDPGSGHFLVLAGRERAIAELTAAGEVVRVARLRAALHRQPEGLGVAPDGTLWVSDEASGARATLTGYRRAP